MTPDSLREQAENVQELIDRVHVAYKRIMAGADTSDPGETWRPITRQLQVQFDLHGAAYGYPVRSALGTALEAAGRTHGAMMTLIDADVEEVKTIQAIARVHVPRLVSALAVLQQELLLQADTWHP